MEEKIIDADDYADWLKWVSDAKRRKQTMFESTNFEEIPVLLQIHETEGGDVHNNSNNKLTTSDNDEVSTR
jgi:glyoxylate carboligase